MSKIDTSTEAVTKLLDGVTPGPWAVDGEDQGAAWGMAWSVHAAENILDVKCDGVDTEENARFIAAARDLVPALLAERDALKAEVERLKAQPAQAVKVGTLVWDYLDGVPDYHVWEVLTVLGRYKVQQSIESDYALLVRPNGAINQHPTIEAAKAAAQSNYEDRIMAALEPQPITVQDAARVLVAAVKAGAIDPFDCTDLAVEALAIKHAGNRRDGVGQLEIAEEFFVAALTAIAEGRA